MILSGGTGITEPVMKPVMVILIGALLIAAGIMLSASLPPGVAVVFGIGGVATILVGIAMLFALAQKNKP